jgi:hypothetical protein
MGHRTPTQQDPMKTLQDHMSRVQINEIKPRARASKRKLDPYEDVKSLIYQELRFTTDPGDRIVRFEKELTCLLDDRWADQMHDRAVGLLDEAIEREKGKIGMGRERERVGKRGRSPVMEADE